MHMADASLEQRAKDLPERPGVYIFRGPGGEVLYVGKALNLRSRVRSYLQPPGRLGPRVGALMEQARDLECLVTDSELDALILELNLIKRYRPRFNVRYADDKQYPYLRVNVKEPFPRVTVVRRARQDGARYFGPYARAGAMRDALRLAGELFPLRTCSDRRLAQGGRPCLYHHIRRCSAPCVGAVSEEEYRDMVRGLCLFLEGRLREAVRSVKAQMEEAASSLNFERAAVLRDRMRALEEATQRQKVVWTDPRDQDVVGLARAVGQPAGPRRPAGPGQAEVSPGEGGEAWAAESSPQACAQVLCVREGKLVGQEQALLRQAEGLSDAEVLGAFLKQYYARATFIPPEILLSTRPEDEELITAWLERQRGGRVELTVPRRGAGRRLVDMAEENAALALGEAGRPGREAAAVAELGSALGLGRAPRRIEGFDVSNLQGQETVGSMVVFEGGRPDPGQYRRFRVRRSGAPDDCASLGEVLRRRFKRGLAERAQGGGGRFSELPDLLLVDGEDYGTFPDTDVLLGSTYYARNPPPGPRPAYAVLLDMVGAANARFYQEGYSLTAAPEVVADIWSVAQALGHGDLFIARPGGYVTDDHVPLQEVGIKAVNIIDDIGRYTPWHTPDDTLDKLSARTLEAVGQVVMTLIRRER
ncbi:MAG: M28 family peptidase [Acetobacteraceae bacterium]|nr:M28 family peptidase [Acetobacteraceae bacterium]